MIIDVVELHVSPPILKARSLIKNSRITFIIMKTPKICICDNQFLVLNFFYV